MKEKGRDSGKGRRSNVTTINKFNKGDERMKEKTKQKTKKKGEKGRRVAVTATNKLNKGDKRMKEKTKQKTKRSKQSGDIWRGWIGKDVSERYMWILQQPMPYGTLLEFMRAEARKFRAKTPVLYYTFTDDDLCQEIHSWLLALINSWGMWGRGDYSPEHFQRLAVTVVLNRLHNLLRDCMRAKRNQVPLLLSVFDEEVVGGNDGRFVDAEKRGSIYWLRKKVRPDLRWVFDYLYRCSLECDGEVTIYKAWKLMRQDNIRIGYRKVKWYWDLIEQQLWS